MNELENYLTAKQIAEQFNVSRDHVTLLIRRGKLKAVQLGREYLIARDEWERYEQNKKPWGAKRGARKTKKTRKIQAPALAKRSIESPRRTRSKKTRGE